MVYQNHKQPQVALVQKIPPRKTTPSNNQTINCSSKMPLQNLPRPSSLSQSLTPFRARKPNICLQLTRQRLRHASSTTPSKASNLRPLVLEKPDKFRPPSHPARIKAKNPRSFGPALSEEDKVRQKTKKYPNMFPPEGTVMFKFLTSRMLHVYICMVCATPV
jgi:hypothetical protein